MEKVSPIAALYNQQDPVECAKLAQDISVEESTGVLRSGAPQFDQFDGFLKEYVDIQMEEDAWRSAFQRKQNPQPKMVDVYGESGSFVYQKRPERAPAYCVLYPIDKVGAPSIVTEAKFRENWASFTNGIFEGVDLSGVIAAGGSVLGCLLPGYSLDEYAPKAQEDLRNQVLQTVMTKTGLMPDLIPNEMLGHSLNGFYTSDLDLFVCGSSQSEAAQRAEKILAKVMENNGSDVVMRSSQAITVLGKGVHRDVQIVFRLYSQPAEVVIGFDLDCAGVYYDFSSQRVFATPRARLSINSRTNVLNQTRRSTTYGTRLIKYAERGFAIVVPGFSRNLFLAEEIPAVSKQYAYKGNNVHLRTAHEDLYLQSLIEIERNWNEARQLNKKVFVQNELNSIIQEDLYFLGVTANLRRQNIEPAELLFVGGSKKMAKKLVETIAVLMMRQKSENQLQNIESRYERQTLAAGRRNTRKNKAVAKGVVEDEVEDNIVDHPYLNEQEPKDVLSHQFHYTSDYCTPSSYGFHSSTSLTYAVENPRMIAGLFIGRYSSQYPLKFLIDNPGQQGLMTASFHPVSTLNYYGDLRMFFGKAAFQQGFRPETSIAMPYKVFFATHFCSVPGYLANVYGQSREERLKYGRIQELLKTQDALKKQLAETPSLAVLGELQANYVQLRKLAEECTNAAVARQNALQQLERAQVTSAGTRQTLPWQWYLSDEEADAFLKQDAKSMPAALAVQRDLFKQSREELFGLKERGVMVQEYAAISDEASQKEATLVSLLADINAQVLQNGKAGAEVFGIKIQLVRPKAAEIYKAVCEADLLDRMQFKLFKAEEDFVRYDEERQLLEARVTLQLLEQAKPGQLVLDTVKKCFNKALFDRMDVFMQHDFSAVSFCIKVADAHPLTEFLNEIASFDLLQDMVHQLRDLVIEKEVDGQLNAVYATGTRVVFARMPEEQQSMQRIMADGFQEFLVNNLGLHAATARYCLQEKQRNADVLQVPGHMIRELIQKPYGKTTENIRVEGETLGEMLYAFRVLRTFKNNVIVELPDSKFFSGVELTQRVFQQIGAVFEQQQSNLYLIGRALSFALSHCIKLKAEVPIQLFRLFLNPAFRYSRQTLDEARFDLLANKIDFDKIDEFAMNGLTYSRKQMGHELFIVMLANYELIARHQDKINAIQSGFQDFGGLAKEMGSFNATQLQKLIQ